MDFKVTFASEEVKAVLIQKVTARFGKPPVGKEYYARIDPWGKAYVETVEIEPPPAPALVEEAGAEKGADDGSD